MFSLKMKINFEKYQFELWSCPLKKIPKIENYSVSLYNVCFFFGLKYFQQKQFLYYVIKIFTSDEHRRLVLFQTRTKQWYERDYSIHIVVKSTYIYSYWFVQQFIQEIQAIKWLKIFCILPKHVHLHVNSKVSYTGNWSIMYTSVTWFLLTDVKLALHVIKTIALQEILMVTCGH